MSRPSEGAREPITKAIDLITAVISHGGKPVGVRELATQTDMAPSTVHRLLAVLERRCLVERDDTGRYAIGLELFRWGSRLAGLFNLRETALPRVRDLAHETNETALLGVYNATTQLMMYTASVESSHPLRYVLELEKWRPIYAGASGLAIMAFLPADEQQAIVDRSGLAPVTERTITDPETLHRELAKIRRRGYALTSGQNIPGAVGLAAPIFDGQGAVVGDVCLTIPEQRYDATAHEDLTNHLIDCVRDISISLGAQVQTGVWPPSPAPAADAPA
ncbi:IclR family transcriptional regulator [Micromonospora sp. WMMD1082]|uniref:IclR family transcriptional regulator n=1 Tax=Micromonospora sp. WMMD1082 TaxID=3016104 RepID=UPI002416F42F|nr:IclR family transcriptional regulator [Micromonospora sp. WMMD1082]MDG4798344.1 IclR family transcriptional regulator [Micromonospora sp. WMMD1082]